LRWHDAAIAAGADNNDSITTACGTTARTGAASASAAHGWPASRRQWQFAVSPPAAEFIQQVAYQSSGNGIMGQPGPLSLAASGTGAFRDGERAIKTFRSPGSSVAISGNRSNSGRMGVTLTVDPLPNSDFPNHVSDAPITIVSQAPPPGLLASGPLSRRGTGARR
jgi:hypothetical protein